MPTPSSQVRIEGSQLRLEACSNPRLAFGKGPFLRRRCQSETRKFLYDRARRRGQRVGPNANKFIAESRSPSANRPTPPAAFGLVQRPAARRAGVGVHARRLYDKCWCRPSWRGGSSSSDWAQVRPDPNLSKTAARRLLAEPARAYAAVAETAVREIHPNEQY